MCRHGIETLNKSIGAVVHFRRADERMGSMVRLVRGALYCPLECYLPNCQERAPLAERPPKAMNGFRLVQKAGERREERKQVEALLLWTWLCLDTRDPFN